MSCWPMILIFLGLLYMDEAPLQGLLGIYFKLRLRSGEPKGVGFGVGGNLKSWDVNGFSTSMSV
jgi:hypothetical protein